MGTEQFAALIAMDWSDATHDLCLFATSPSRQADSVLTPTPAALAAWATARRTRVAGRPIAVCLEQSRGPPICALLKYALLVLDPSDPATLAKDRDAFSPSRAKDDPRDADDRLALLLQRRDRLQAWRPANAKTRTLHYLVAHRRRLVNDRPRLSSRMTAPLKAYVPQVLPWLAGIRAPLACDLLRCWPTLAAMQKGRPSTLEQLFHAHHAARQATIANRMAAIKAAAPLTPDPAVRRASVLMIKAFATRMKTTIAASHTVGHAIEKRCHTHEGDHLCASLPGAGPA
jgi:Transposase